MGRFTRECKVASLIAEGLQVKLIDVKNLLKLLSENSIGVTRQEVTLYHIDDEYFSSSNDTSATSEN
jgi:restriction endonuclease Mrr